MWLGMTAGCTGCSSQSSLESGGSEPSCKPRHFQTFDIDRVDCTCSPLAVEDSALSRNHRLHAGRVVHAEEDRRSEEASHEGQDIVAIAPVREGAAASECIELCMMLALVQRSSRKLQCRARPRDQDQLKCWRKREGMQLTCGCPSARTLYQRRGR